MRDLSATRAKAEAAKAEAKAAKAAKAEALFDEHKAVSCYGGALAVAADVFGVGAIRAHPVVVFRIRNALEEGRSAADLTEDLRLARDLAKHYVHPTGFLSLEDIADPVGAVFGVYDRVFDPDLATGTPDHLDAARRIAGEVFGGPVPIDVLFEVFDREFGSPYKE